jgi:hypothetical protein
VLGLGVTHFNKELLLVIAAAYYILYFYLATCLEKTSLFLAKASFRCPYCKAGYDAYHCNLCGKTSIHINTPLMSKFVKTTSDENKILEHKSPEDETDIPF